MFHLEPREVDLDGVGDDQAGAEDDGQGLAQAVEARLVRASRRKGLGENGVAHAPGKVASQAEAGKQAGRLNCLLP